MWCKRKLFGRRVYKLDSSRAKQVIKEQYNKLGRIRYVCLSKCFREVALNGCVCVCVCVCRYAEVLVLVMFVLLVILWFTRDPKFIPGWSALFKSEENGNR